MKDLRIVYLLGALITGTGCATSAIPKEIRQQASPAITFAQVHQNPESFKGKTILWGGEILSLTNAKEGTTLQLLQIPTDSEGHPLNPESSEGRFIAFIDKYLDGAIYQRGREVTIFGDIQGSKAQALGENQFEYVFPVVSARNIYLWPRGTSAYTVYPDPWLDPYWNAPYGYWGPGWHARMGFGYNVP